MIKNDFMPVEMKQALDLMPYNFGPNITSLIDAIDARAAYIAAACVYGPASESGITAEAKAAMDAAMSDLRGRLWTGDLK